MINEITRNQIKELVDNAEKDLHDTIRDLKNQGKTYAEIQKELGLKSNYHIKKALGKTYKVPYNYVKRINRNEQDSETIKGLKEENKKLRTENKILANTIEELDKKLHWLLGKLSKIQQAVELDY